jgi:hypothetical protein
MRKVKVSLKLLTSYNSLKPSNSLLMNKSIVKKRIDAFIIKKQLQQMAS